VKHGSRHWKRLPAQSDLRREPKHLKGASQMRDQRINSGALDGRQINKRCTDCQEVKPPEEFYADRRGRLTSRCRDCHRRLTKANNRRRQIALRLLITAHFDEYRALLNGERAEPNVTTAPVGGGPDVA
jgi:hypothetical protein